MLAPTETNTIAIRKETPVSRHIQTQTEWEATMARRIMDQLRGELYLD